MPAIFRTVHDEEPSAVIRREVGPLDGIKVAYSSLLVCTYLRPATRTVGGLEIPDKAVEEDRYQSKVGLVLKVGPRAFVDDGPAKFFGFAVAPGAWVLYRPSEGLKLTIGERQCQLIQDVHVRMVLDHPDLVG
jgi:co-chaperonin GroES (HSP10)